MKRRTALVLEKKYEKAYYAVLWLQTSALSEKTGGWVNIDTLHSFLKTQQKICDRSGGKEMSAWALWPKELFPLGWEEDEFIRIVSELCRKNLLFNKRRPEGNFFRCVPPEQQGLYQLRSGAAYEYQCKEAEKAAREGKIPTLLV